jgi:acyl carrier protein
MKVRNQRIEPAEVEEALLALDAVKEAVVAVRDVGPDQQCLVAYIVPAPQSAPTASALRRALAERLPDAIIPSKYVVLEALPLTPTGKVDRRALPAPDTTRPALDSPFVKPRTPIEAKLAVIWADVLGLEEVGMHDSFLELGGHSLLATKLIARVIDVFAVELPLRTLFEAPTVAEMAVVIIQHQVNTADQEQIERMLTALEALADEQAQRLRADETGLSERLER